MSLLNRSALSFCFILWFSVAQVLAQQPGFEQVVFDEPGFEMSDFDYLEFSDKKYQKKMASAKRHLNIQEDQSAAWDEYVNACGAILKYEIDTGNYEDNYNEVSLRSASALNISVLEKRLNDDLNREVNETQKYLELLISKKSSIERLLEALTPDQKKKFFSDGFLL